MVAYRPIANPDLGRVPKAAPRLGRTTPAVATFKPATAKAGSLSGPRRSIYKPVLGLGSIRPVKETPEVEFEEIPEDTEVTEDLEQTDEALIDPIDPDDAIDPSDLIDQIDEAEGSEGERIDEDFPSDELPEDGDIEALEEADEGSKIYQVPSNADAELSAKNLSLISLPVLIQLLVVTTKRRKISSGVSFSLEPEKLQLLGRWNLANDRAARYVMQELRFA
eukprot:s2982_g3.t2